MNNKLNWEYSLDIIDQSDLAIWKDEAILHDYFSDQSK
jgi:hypothetical protein